MTSKIIKVRLDIKYYGHLICNDVKEIRHEVKSIENMLWYQNVRYDVKNCWSKMSNIINLAKQGYCNHFVCLFICFLCVRYATQHNTWNITRKIYDAISWSVHVFSFGGKQGCAEVLSLIETKLRTPIKRSTSPVKLQRTLKTEHLADKTVRLACKTGERPKKMCFR